MAGGGDNGQFDLQALQRVGDFTNDRAEWKEVELRIQGLCGCGFAAVCWS